MSSEQVQRPVLGAAGARANVSAPQPVNNHNVDQSVAAPLLLPSVIRVEDKNGENGGFKYVLTKLPPIPQAVSQTVDRPAPIAVPLLAPLPTAPLSTAPPRPAVARGARPPPSYDFVYTRTPDGQLLSRPVAAAPQPSLPTGSQKPAPKAPAASKKRKAPTTLAEDIAAYKQNLDDIITQDMYEDDQIPSCKAVRNRINKLLDSGIMNKTEFCRTIGHSIGSLNRFLQAGGPMGGAQSWVYQSAWYWFRQRDIARIRMPDVKKRQKMEADAAEAEAAAARAAAEASGAVLPAATASKPKASGKKTANNLPDISDIYLDGEEEDDVPIYESCDEVRKKINQHLKTPGLTQAQFCRDLYAQLNVPKIKSIQSKQLADFRAMKGSRTGAKSTVFYTAYVYFEKMRIAMGKPKTEYREIMEELWAGRGGFSRTEDHRTEYITLSPAPFYFDEFGLMAGPGRRSFRDL